MNDEIKFFIDKIEQLVSEKGGILPHSFLNQKNQLASKDYAMAEKLRTNKGELYNFNPFFDDDEIIYYRNELQKVISKLKLEKEHAKLNN